MRLDHQIDVPLGLDAVWRALNDPERVAPCMPGATLTSVEGDTFSATVKVKVGPIAMTYAGSAEFVARDDAAHRMTVKASGREKNGSGRASATVEVALAETGGRTTGAITTDLTITGRAAQFGRGMISEVGGRILEEFSANLTALLAAADASGAEPENNTATGPVDAIATPDSLDLLQYSTTSPVKRWIGRIAAVLAYPVVRLIALLRGRRVAKQAR